MKIRHIIVPGTDLFRLLADYLGDELPNDARFTGFTFNTVDRLLSADYESFNSDARNIEIKCDLRQTFTAGAGAA